MRTWQEGAGYGSGPSPEPDLGLPAFRTVRNTFLLFVSYPGSVFHYSSQNGLRQWGQKYQALLPTPPPPQPHAGSNHTLQQHPGMALVEGAAQIKKWRVRPKGALWAVHRETGPARVTSLCPLVLRAEVSVI